MPDNELRKINGYDGVKYPQGNTGEKIRNRRIEALIAGGVLLTVISGGTLVYLYRLPANGRTPFAAGTRLLQELKYILPDKLNLDPRAWFPATEESQDCGPPGLSFMTYGGSS